MLILVMGDFHIPDRAEMIPKQIKESVEKKIYDMVISTGDYTIPEILEWVRSISRRHVCVHGNMDDWEIMNSLPTMKTVEIEGKKICVFHGNGIWPRGDPSQLSSIAKKCGASIMISGHTHKPTFGFHDGVYLLNPGSATGAFSGTGARYPPSYMEINTNGWRITLKLLKGKNMEIKEYRME